MDNYLFRCGWLRILPLLCQLKKTSRTMKKILVTMMALALTIAAQGQTETIDTSKFVVTYDYAVQTKMGIDDREIVDSCCVALMVGTRHTMQMEYYQYACQCLGDRSVEIEMIRNSIHLYPTIYGNYPDGKMTTREFLAPRDGLCVQDGYLPICRQELDGMLYRGHPLDRRPVETARAARTDCPRNG